LLANAAFIAAVPLARATRVQNRSPPSNPPNAPPPDVSTLVTNIVRHGSGGCGVYYTHRHNTMVSKTKTTIAKTNRWRLHADQCARHVARRLLIVDHIGVVSRIVAAQSAVRRLEIVARQRAHSTAALATCAHHKKREFYLFFTTIDAYPTTRCLIQFVPVYLYVTIDSADYR
jgi:hypothetical protein